MSSGETVSVLAARPALEELRIRGVDAGPLLATAGLSVQALRNVDNRLLGDSVDRWWAAAAAAVSDPAFGLHAAEDAPRGSFDVIEYIDATAKSVGQGIERTTRYLPLLDERLAVAILRKKNQTRLQFRFESPSTQYKDFLLAHFVVTSRIATRVEWHPDAVFFDHPAPATISEHQRLFRCPLTFGAPRSEVILSRKVLELPHVNCDSALLNILIRYADTLLAELPPRGTLRARTTSTIARGLSTHLPTLASTATALRIPERTLQRRLASEKTTYSKLLEETRHDLALRYLGRAEVSILEIAFLLHFADGSAFHHAFKRWTGETPGEYRARHFGWGKRKSP